MGTTLEVTMRTVSKLSLLFATLAFVAACSDEPKAAAVEVTSVSPPRSASVEPRPVRVAEAALEPRSIDDDAGVGRTIGAASDENPLVRKEEPRLLSPEERRLAELEDALAQDPNLVEAREELVRAYLDRDPARARAHAEVLTRARPDDAGAHYALGRTYMKLAMWSEAVASFERALVLKPGSTYAHNNLGYSALQIGNTELALEHLEAILELSPRQPYMLNNLGIAYERAGRRADAFAAYLRALELKPGYVKAVVNKQRLQPTLSDGELAVALEILEELAEEPVPAETTAEAQVEVEGGLTP